MLFLDADIVTFRDPALSLVGDADLEGQIDEFGLPNARDPHHVPQLCG
jgi:hypothetical protein